MQIEKTKEKIVPRIVNSLPFCEKVVSILSIKKRSMVIPNPAIDPVAKIVISKNFRPKKATTKPNRIDNIPRIYGFLTKNLAKAVTENTGQALELLPLITGLHISSVLTVIPFISLAELLSFLSHLRFTVNL